MAAVWNRELVNYLCSHGNFNFFHGIEHHAPQFSIKNIEFYDLLKGYWNDEEMIRLCVILEWIGIGPEPVITDVGETMYGKSLITNGKTPCFQFRYLVGD